MISLHKERSTKGSKEKGKRCECLNPKRLVHKVKKEKKSKFVNPFLSPSVGGFMTIELFFAARADLLMVFFPVMVILGAIILKKLRFENEERGKGYRCKRIQEEGKSK